MFFRKIFALLSVLIMGLFGISLPVLAQTPTQTTPKNTITNSSADRNKLLGEHRLSLQWLSLDYYGSLTIEDEGDYLSLYGRQEGNDDNPEADDFVSIDGYITQIDHNRFTFRGEILTKVYHINNGKVCRREGDLTFAVTQNRKYWRLQEMSNPCDQVVDYVDIYFKK